MEAVVFMGLPASGKTSFYKERFFSTHVRINLDLLKTRHRELLLLDACIQAKQKFVIDNTNPTRADRSRYIEAAKTARLDVVGYYFQSVIEECLKRNETRSETERVPDVAVLSKATKLELPSFDEGFDQLFYVQIKNGEFVVEEWNDEI
ncbi:MAG: kinase [Gimesia sp.]|uniref:AAA family ATPase n=1 Tax=Gimesia sp. TaxID=2024833 RepID=UPI000C4D3B6F|nr:AAA family ATPase [Gimesia sp.]MAX35748.1 kinase [Gimesia sp.]|tara:strand:- start:196 stop:642 length:447 start_codon:yes stop_codon:yes gene_type:complete